ncbi:response regulator [Synechocystis sp. LKSZ1]|uniref:hybrid sensor histidine kinase/response regulator n=1 Tax=Synechocystis sp. LKSZ1 TaxID=3144951 RepID=UPI00336BEADE
MTKITSQTHLKALEQEVQSLRQQLAATRARLEENEDVLQAIRSGAVDAIIVSNEEGERIFTLQGADYVYQRLVEQMGEGAATVAEDGLILYANQELARLLNCSLNNLIGSYLIQFVAPQDQKSLGILLNSIQNKEILTQELSLMTATEEVIPVKLSLKKIDIDHLSFNSIIITDITESKIKEAAKISQILNSAIIVIKNFRLLTNGTLQIDNWLGGTQALFGYSIEAINQDPTLMTEQIFPEDREKLLSSLTQDIQAGRPGMMSYRFWHLDQTVHWLSSSYVAEWNVNQNCWQGLEIITDITQLKQLEQQFYHAQRLESLGTLASGIAHDFNNILTPIMGATQLLKMQLSQTDNRQTQRLLNLLLTSAERAINLVKQILFFSRGGETEHTHLHLENVLKDVINVAQQTFPKSIKLSLHRQMEALWMVDADATQMHQVFMNLLINARDAMPQGGLLTLLAKNCTLDENFVHSHWEAKVGRYVVIQVIDTGLGIDPSVLDRIFEPFFTTKEPGKGTGLGLSTVAGILKSHGGFILVSSQLGEGSTFEVFLPATDAVAITPSLPPSPREGRDELILVVDDEASVRDITQASLETYHYHTLLAKDGQEAIDLYREHQREVRIVLMDMMMPNVTGLEAIRGIQQINPQVKIIAISGLVENKALAMEAGVKAFLLKPYAITQLLQLLETLLSPEAIPESPESLALMPASRLTPGTVSRADLANLSPDWLRKMYEAAYRVDTDEMLEVIDQLPNDQTAIAQALKELVLDFNTETILDITRISEDA